LPERAKYPCDCVVVIIVSIEVPRAKTQTPPDLVVKPQAVDIIGFIYGWSCVWNFLFDTLTLQLAVNHDRRDGANL
jgi:hypothetical protein